VLETDESVFGHEARRRKHCNSGCNLLKFLNFRVHVGPDLLDLTKGQPEILEVENLKRLKPPDRHGD